MKLILALLKSKNEKKAKKWLDTHSDEFKSMPSSMSEHFKKRLGIDWEYYYYAEYMPLTFYDECLLKIRQVTCMLKESGIMYKNFEEAAHFYELNGRIDGDSDEIMEFNRNMEFVYAGRKAVCNDKNPDDYVAANIWTVNRIR